MEFRHDNSKFSRSREKLCDEDLCQNGHSGQKLFRWLSGFMRRRRKETEDFDEVVMTAIAPNVHGGRYTF